jgi:hypothetical protein
MYSLSELYVFKATSVMPFIHVALYLQPINVYAFNLFRNIAVCFPPMMIATKLRKGDPEVSAKCVIEKQQCNNGQTGRQRSHIIIVIILLLKYARNIG